IPKADENQEEYHSYVSPMFSSLLAFPVTVWQEQEALAVPVIEAMNYVAYYDTRSVLIDTMLKESRGATEADVEMLELIIESRSYDFGQMTIVQSALARSWLADNIVRASAQNNLDAERLGTEGLSTRRHEQELFARFMELLMR
ncbi:MAG: hypothetical protein IJW97_06895, partial [Clostridia bacterium]|nr:hypothetical protein [Clostridia bacterium]